MILRPGIQYVFGKKKDTETFELQEDYLIDQDDSLKKLLTWFFNLVIQLEAIQQSGAEPYERNEARIAQRNGYKERSLKTRVGELILKKPQFRECSFKFCISFKFFVNSKKYRLCKTNKNLCEAGG